MENNSKVTCKNCGEKCPCTMSFCPTCGTKLTHQNSITLYGFSLITSEIRKFYSNTIGKYISFADSGYNEFIKLFDVHPTPSAFFKNCEQDYLYILKNLWSIL